MNAAANGQGPGHLSVVEYLVERGADTEAKDSVSHVIIDMKPHICHT